MSKRRLFLIACVLAIIVIPIAESTRVDAAIPIPYCTADDRVWSGPGSHCMAYVTQDCPWYSFIDVFTGGNSCTMNACIACDRP